MILFRLVTSLYKKFLKFRNQDKAVFFKALVSYLASLAKGVGTIIKAVGNGFQHGFEGLGKFIKDLTVSVGNATGTVLQSTGYAFKDVASGPG